MKSKPSFNQLLSELKRLGRPEVVKTKELQFGIIATNALGLYQTDIKIFAKEIGYNEVLAIQLFDTGIYEARLLCSRIYPPSHLTSSLMEAWVKTFENWEICDSYCMGLFSRSKFAIPKALKWSRNDAEFVKRAGFVIMASYGFAHKDATNDIFQQFFPIMVREARDERKYVVRLSTGLCDKSENEIQICVQKQ